MEEAAKLMVKANAERGLTLEDAKKLSYKWINTWQPFDHEVEQDPLVILDPRTLQPSDLVEYRYGGYAASAAAPSGPMSVCANSQHRWYWFPRMTPDEILFTKQLDME